MAPEFLYQMSDCVTAGRSGVWVIMKCDENCCQSTNVFVIETWIDRTYTFVGIHENVEFTEQGPDGVHRVRQEMSGNSKEVSNVEAETGKARHVHIPNQHYQGKPPNRESLQLPF
jgi:hypothetical protein